MLCLVAQSCLTLHDPMDCSPPGSCVHGYSPGKNTGEVCPLPGDLPNLGIKPRSPALHADSLLSEPAGPPLTPKLWAPFPPLPTPTPVHHHPTRLFCTCKMSYILASTSSPLPHPKVSSMVLDSIYQAQSQTSSQTHC